MTQSRLGPYVAHAGQSDVSVAEMSGYSHWRRHIPHLLEVCGVEGVLAQRAQQGDEHLNQEHGAHQHIHVLLQLCHLQHVGSNRRHRTKCAGCWI